MVSPREFEALQHLELRLSSRRPSLLVLGLRRRRGDESLRREGLKLHGVRSSSGRDVDKAKRFGDVAVVIDARFGDNKT